MRAPRRRISFRVAIVGVVVGLLLVTCGALLGVGASSSARNIDALEHAYLDQVARASIREVARIPETAERVLRVQRYRLDTGFYRLGDPTSVARGLAGSLEADPSILWVSYSDAATGRFFGARRLKDDRFVLNVSDPRVNGGVPREYLADTGAPFTRTPALTAPYEPRSRDWYGRAVAAEGGVVWMPPYTFAEGVRGITAAMALKDPGGRVRGVLTVDFSLAALASFLSRIEVGARGVVVVFQNDGALLAGNPGPGLEAAARAVPDFRRHPRARGDQIQHTELPVAGEPWDVAALPVAVAPGLEWTVATAVPNDDFTGPIYTARRWAIAVALAFLGLAVIAGFLVASGIADSLGRASRALDQAARFDLHALPARRSVILEVSQLEDAVGRVTASLLSFSRYAPEEIVRDVVLSGREAILSGERRDVTVLFADLRGFTAFAEGIRPEEVVAILNDHFELLVATIARHRGFVVDFLGDAVFAVFGAPERAPDHVEQAVACAIEILRARTARDEANRARGWPPLEMGVGLDTGPAVVGNMGSDRRIKYGVVGSIVNTAARIETFTVGGQALVSDGIHQALGDRLVVDGPLEVEGKGVATTLRLWDVLALRGEKMLVLPSAVRDLATLARPLEADMRLYFGKQLEKQSHAARVHRLGAGGAELTSEAPLGLFSAVHVQLPGPANGSGIDGKVVSLSEDDGVFTALVRFTGLGWDARDQLDALARRSR